ncbi:unnamed protein product [Adineta steineri]|uniref:Uncharacterized protein n=2 Tax=Adineta steineri TaxID=433720 RepID=A0A820HMU7_9BILA|nr:unnamed protein product [Adineta steineri]
MRVIKNTSNKTFALGTLAIHMVIWLDHDLTPVCMKNNVQNEAFKERLISYLEDIIKEDLDLFRESNDTGLNESGTFTFILAIFLRWTALGT